MCPTFPLNPKVRIELKKPNDWCLHRLNVIGRHITRNNNKGAIGRYQAQNNRFFCLDFLLFFSHRGSFPCHISLICVLFIPGNHVFAPLDIRPLSSLVSRGGLAAQSCLLTVLNSGFHVMDSGFQVLDSSLCQ